MVMSEVILYTIVEKLEGIEIALFKENTEPKDDPSHQILSKELTSFRDELKIYSAEFKTAIDGIN